MRGVSWILIAIGLGLGLPACGDDDDDVDADGDADADADGDGDGDTDADGDADADADGDADGDGDGDLSSVTVHVLTHDTVGARAPASGAAVAFDPVGGERIEQTADAEGRTTFDGLDWTGDGRAAVMAHLDGWQVGGRVALTAEYVESEIAADGELVVLLGANPNSTEGLVEIHGTATMIDGTNHLLAVVPIGRGTTFVGQGPDWAVFVAPDEPFTLVAVEWSGGWTEMIFQQPFYAWQIVEHDGVSQSTAVDVELVSDPVEVSTFSGTLVRPTDTIGTFYEEATPFPVVYSLTGGQGLFTGSRFGFMGEVNEMDGTGAPTFTYEGEYNDIASVEDPGTIFYWWINEVATVVVVPGYPTDETPDLNWLEPPNVTTPAAGEPHAMGDALGWALNATDAANEAVDVIVQLLDADKADTLTTVFAPPGTTSVEIPLPPSSVDPAELYGEGATGVVRLCELDEEGRICMREAVGRFIEIVP